MNDIVTGWIEIVKADRRMNAMFVDLIRKEEHIVDGTNRQKIRNRCKRKKRSEV